jgi:hypothetical protein
MGYEVREQGQQGSAHSIWIDPRTGTAIGIPDLRDSNPKAAAAH